MPRHTVLAPDAPAAIGPYAHAAGPVGTELLCRAGQTPIDTATGALVTGNVAVQTATAFANLAAVLRAADESLDDVVEVNVYLVDMADFAAVNRADAEQFTAPYRRARRSRSPRSRWPTGRDVVGREARCRPGAPSHADGGHGFSARRPPPARAPAPARPRGPAASTGRRRRPGWLGRRGRRPRS